PEAEQLALFDDDEREQLERNRDFLRARAEEIPAEIEREVASLRRRSAEPELAERLKQAHAEWLANRELRRPDPAIHTTFLDFVLREVLGYPDEVIADSQELGDAYTATLPEHRVTLRPDLAIRRPGEPPTLLVTRHPAQVSL